jgi:hypothetical protein
MTTRTQQTCNILLLKRTVLIGRAEWGINRTVKSSSPRLGMAYLPIKMTAANRPALVRLLWGIVLQGTQYRQTTMKWDAADRHGRTAH